MHVTIIIFMFKQKNRLDLKMTITLVRLIIFFLRVHQCFDFPVKLEFHELRGFLIWSMIFTIDCTKNYKDIELHLTISRASSFDLVMGSSRHEEGRREPECFTRR